MTTVVTAAALIDGTGAVFRPRAVLLDEARIVAMFLGGRRVV